MNNSTCTSPHLVATTQATNIQKAVEEIASQVDIETLNALQLYYTQHYSPDLLRQALVKRFPGVRFHGCSTCRGVLTNSGFIEGPVIGVSVTQDPKLDSCNAIATFDSLSKQEITQQTKLALSNALEQSDRLGEVPHLVLLHGTVGTEESVLAAIDDYFGMRVPVLGGTAADDQIKGHWSIMTQDGVVKQGISLSCVFGDITLNTSFGTGYVTTENVGKVTLAKERYVYEIDGKPAAQVYKQWTKSILQADQYQNLMEHTGHVPLGAPIATLSGEHFYQVFHPVRLCDKDDAIELFAELPQDTEIKLMHGSQDHMVARVSRIVGDASASLMSAKGPASYLSMFCAGSMYSIYSHLPDIAKQLNESYNNAPFLCPFTFGEQGLTVADNNTHGNLMISTVAFA